MKKSSQKEKKRPSLQAELQRNLFLETGYRCAVPSCNVTDSLEIAHIHALAKGGKTDFDNLIVLCANCHAKYDKGNTNFFDKKAMLKIKANLQLMNGRYSSFELRLLKYFLDSKKGEILLFGRNVDVYFLIKDKLLEESPKQFQNAVNFPPKLYLLTAKGESFIEMWKRGQKLSD